MADQAIDCAGLDGQESMQVRLSIGEQVDSVIHPNQELNNLNIRGRIPDHVQLLEHVEAGNQLIDHVTAERQLLRPVNGEDQLMDHVDGHTLSTVPLTVGCPDPSMLSNIFQVKARY